MSDLVEAARLTREIETALIQGLVNDPVATVDHVLPLEWELAVALGLVEPHDG